MAIRLSVVVVLTPFQGMVAQSIIESAPVPGNWIVLANGPKVVTGRDFGGTQVRIIDPPVPIRFFSGGREAARRAVDRLLAGIPSEDSVDFLLANVDHPLGNRVLWEVRARGGGRLRLSSYPDGIASIAATRLSIRKWCANLAKRLGGAVLGTPYAPYGADLGGRKVAWRSFTVLPPDRFPEFEKDILVPLDREILREGEKKGDGVLVLGQPLGGGSARRHARMLQRGLLRAALAEPGPHLYKPHPRERIDSVDAAVQAGLTLIQDERPVEEILGTFPVRIVLAHFSSALVHLKLMYADEIRCIAINPLNAMRVNGDSAKRWRELSVTFDRLGIEVRYE